MTAKHIHTIKELLHFSDLSENFLLTNLDLYMSGPNLMKFLLKFMKFNEILLKIILLI